MEHHISIEVLSGGYVITYPEYELAKFGFTNAFATNARREVFTSMRKVTQKIKEILEALEAADKEAAGSSPEPSEPS